MWYFVVFQPSKCKKNSFSDSNLINLTHFPKWLRKSAKSLLYKTKKLRNSEFLQKFWVGWRKALVTTPFNFLHFLNRWTIEQGRSWSSEGRGWLCLLCLARIPIVMQVLIDWLWMWSPSVLFWHPWLFSQRECGWQWQPCIFPIRPHAGQRTGGLLSNLLDSV